MPHINKSMLAVAWVAVLMFLGVSSPAYAGVFFPTPDLPPLGGKYQSLDGEMVIYDFTPFGGPVIKLQEIMHTVTSDRNLITRTRENIGRDPNADDQKETFASTVSGMLMVGGGPFVPFATPIDRVTSMVIVFDKYDPPPVTGPERLTGRFETEMRQLDLMFTLPDGTIIMIQENPDEVSSGITSVTAVPGGFDIQSSFDVRTQAKLSRDNGLTFTPFVSDSFGDGSHDVALVPEPGTITLVTLAAAGMIGYGWRRRKQAS
jgi:hypothetical protein